MTQRENEKFYKSHIKLQSSFKFCFNIKHIFEITVYEMKS